MNGYSSDEASMPEDTQICSLIDGSTRCKNTAGNSSFNKKLEKIVLQKRLELRLDQQAKHNYICDKHNFMINNSRPKRRRRETLSIYRRDDSPSVNLGVLQMNTLKRYRKQYKIQSKPGIQKSQLVDVLSRHFSSIPVDDNEAFYFVYMVKTRRNKLDQSGSSGFDRRDDSHSSGSS